MHEIVDSQSLLRTIMSPALTVSSDKSTTNANAIKAQARPTYILHRTPWRPPVATRAEGIYIDLEDGRRVIDAVGGAAVACIGSGNQTVIEAIKAQADELTYVYNMQLSNGPAEELAKFLIESGKGAFGLCGFVSGGSEAMEGAIKLARQYFFETNQPQRVHFIARNLSYHGNTLSTVSLSNNPARRKPYEGILDHEHFHFVSPAFAKRFQRSDESEADYVERLRKELDDKFQELGPGNVIAFVAETVVGATTGALPAPTGYFKAMKSVCDKYGALLILDEVMSGMGRMGTMHAWESFGDGVFPDIQAVAKGLGGGYASIGAVLFSERIAEGIRDHSGLWMHGHTYQAHPLACAAALAVQHVISSSNLLENCRTQGAYLSSLLHSRLQGPNCLARPYTFDIRGGGLFWGIEFDFTDSDSSVAEKKKLDFKGRPFALAVQAKALENGLVVMGFTGCANIEGTRGDHNLLAPPYNVTKDEVEKIVDIFVESVEQVLKEGGA
ncbi:PLP-dependent transferase [Rickenella mellea]|uniref:PLP-dependent transferase n=1 Tax=Rickenella mellea TaxID=50990 RepID=A0A4Y7Q2E9_9AGAM|nr:PLP-dependent transferase [Rickenella mellea]